MAYIGKKPFDIQQALASINTFTGDGSTTTFDVTNSMPNGGDNDVTVVVDNVRQEPGATKSYTIGADGNGDIKRVTFNVAPDDGSEIYVVNPGRPTALIEPSDNTISTAKLQADAVTGAKLADDAVDSEHLVDGSVDNVHLSGSIANAKLANSSITINGTAVSLGGSITAGTDWQAVTVADGSTQITAEAGKGYFLDTNAGVIEVLLPSSPSRGDTVILADYSGTFGTNEAIVNTGGKLIDSTEGGPGSSNDFILQTDNQVVELVFVDDNKGWLVQTNSTPSGLTAMPGGDGYNATFVAATGGTVTTSGDFKIHTFTGDGCFVVSTGGSPAGSTQVSYLVIAGGGGGGVKRAGGGGAGGFREGKSPQTPYTASPIAATSGITVTAQTYPITVGGGGTAGIAANPVCNNATTANTNGSNSVFATITSAGGGAGGGTGTPNGAGLAGGSGGGGVHEMPCRPQSTANSGGAGNTPPVSPAQGFAGGDACQPEPQGQGGGGGGAIAVGADGGDGQTAPKGAGGAGAETEITGSAVTRAGGGGSGARPNGRQGQGGTGGGGPGANDAPKPNGDPASNGTDGTANTGSGGGAGADVTPSTSGAGGKGLVVIRYKFK